MRQVKIEYENFEREENKAMVAEIVLAYAFLFPTWLKTLTVAVYDEQQGKENFNGWSEGSPEYGTVTIGIRTLCMDKPIGYLTELMVHELIHIAHMKVFELIKRTIGMAKERNEELYNFLEEDLRQRDEEFVEHMALGLVDALSPADTLVVNIEDMERRFQQRKPDLREIAKGDGHD